MFHGAVVRGLPVGGAVAALAGIVFAVLAMAGTDSTVTRPSLSGPASVIDGDGLRMGPLSIRIHGIDAPETDQSCTGPDRRRWPCGQAATRRMSELVAGHQVGCTQTDLDRYGRIVAICTADGRDLGAVLVGEGLAWAYLRYSEDYAAIEAGARARRAGIWGGDNPPPWEHRAATRSATGLAAGPRPPDPGCPIKGNISSKGARIYHLPGSRDYDRTRIDEARGERWFCSEAEALAAGWRAPRR